MEAKQDNTKKKPRTLPSQVGEIATGLSTIIQKMDEVKGQNQNNNKK